MTRFGPIEEEYRNRSITYAMERTSAHDEFMRLRRNLSLAAICGICALITYVWVLNPEISPFSTKNLPIIVVGGLAGFLTLLDIRMGLGLMILAIGVSPEFELGGIPNLRLEDFLFPFILLSWLIRFVVKNEPLAPTDLKPPILFLIFLSLISLIENSICSQIDVNAGIVRFAKNIEYFLIFAVVLNSLKKEGDLRKFVYLMTAIGALVGIFGIFQLAQTHERVTGPSGETANILGGYYVFHICLAIGLMASPIRYRIPIALGLLLMVIPLLYTLGRTSYVAFAVGLLAMFALKRQIWMGMILGVCGFAILISSEIAERFLTIINVVEGNAPSSLEARVLGWTFLLNALWEAPILGHGMGSMSLGAFDNESVRQIFELGPLGLLIFLWLLWRILKVSLRLSRQLVDPSLQGFSFGLFGGTIALFMHSMGATTFTTIRTAEAFFFGVGLLYAIAAWSDRQGPGSGSEDEENLPSELPPLPQADGSRAG